MAKLQVLVVDDSRVVRSVVSSVIETAPDIEVACVAPDGSEVLSQLDEHAIDCIVLDVQMPEMDGLETLDALQDHPTEAPVVLFSTETQEGAPTTIEALLKGADAYVPKPTTVQGLEDAAEQLRENLLPKIRSVAGAATRADEHDLETSNTARGTEAASSSIIEESRPAELSPDHPMEVVGIAVSTGGPSAIASVLSQLPADFDAPILIVQHMPPEFTSKLAQRLNRRLSVDIREARDGDPLAPGSVFIAPGDRHLTVEKSNRGMLVRTPEGAKRNACRPSADILFEGLAEHFGSGTVAIVMTGMGSDGREGSRLVSEAGGRVIAQDEESSVVWGMPRGPVDAGIADVVTDPDGIARYLLDLSDPDEPD